MIEKRRIPAAVLVSLALVTGAGCGATAGASGVPPNVPPNVPLNIAASPLSSSTVLVSWDASTGATAYKVQRAPDASGVPGVWGTTSVLATSPLTDTGLTASTRYWYRVASAGSGGDSGFSDPASVSTPSVGGGTAPATPTGVAASPLSSSSIRVSWNASTGATAYAVQRAPDASGAPGPWGSSTNVASSPLTDSGLTASTTYWYRVAASNTAGASSFSSPVSATTQASGGGGTVTTIPAALSVLTTKRIVFAHASVGGNILAGVQTILDGNGSPKPSIVDLGFPTPSPSPLTAGRIGEVGWYDLNTHPWSKVSAFQAYLNSNGLGAVADIAMMKFCFIDFDAGADSVETNARAAQLFSAYQAMVSAVQAAHPGVKLVHFTAAITSAGNGRREAYNNMVRTAYGSSGRLFDLADLESNGHTDSQGRVTDPAYNDGTDHLNTTGKGVVAQALLLFLANLP